MKKPAGQGGRSVVCRGSGQPAVWTPKILPSWSSVAPSTTAAGGLTGFTRLMTVSERHLMRPIICVLGGNSSSGRSCSAASMVGGIVPPRRRSPPLRAAAWPTPPCGSAARSCPAGSLPRSTERPLDVCGRARVNPLLARRTGQAVLALRPGQHLDHRPMTQARALGRGAGARNMPVRHVQQHVLHVRGRDAPDIRPLASSRLVQMIISGTSQRWPGGGARYLSIPGGRGPLGMPDGVTSCRKRLDGEPDIVVLEGRAGEQGGFQRGRSPAGSRTPPRPSPGSCLPVAAGSAIRCGNHGGVSDSSVCRMRITSGCPHPPAHSPYASQPLAGIDDFRFRDLSRPAGCGFCARPEA